MRRLLVLTALLTLAGCGGPGSSASGEGELTVLAAASLKDVFDDSVRPFQQDHPADVTLSFGSSTDLAQQAAEGAPADVLATADQASMQLAVDAGVTGEVTELATNELVIVTPPDNPGDITSLADLAGATWVRCADEVPCGRVALAVLGAAGVSAEPVSLEEDVRAALDKVASGEADAGLVYASDAVAAGDDVVSIEIPEAAEHLTTYVVAPLEQTGDDDLAAAWIDQVTSPEGRRLLTDAGFGLP